MIEQKKGGKLYQKLTEYYQSYAKDPDSTHNFIAGIHDGTKRAKQFLDEAKHDAPKYRIIKKGVAPFSHIGEPPTVADWNDWFEKWFGTLEKP